MRKDIILRHAERRLPRYTSYPTAPQFTPAVGEGAWRQWLGAVPADAALSVYLHVPFCQAMCRYCGCLTKITARYAPIAAYLERLAREIELIAGALPQGVRIGHLHWGGGTPTIIGADAFLRVMAQLRSQITIAGDAEIAVECDPRKLPPVLIDALAEAGVTRVSLGVQTFEPAVQTAIGRVQSFATVLQAVEGLRGAGIQALNFDLLYGLPLQTVAACDETAGLAASLRPDRVAVFGYAHVPWMKPHQRLIDETTLPDGAARLDQFSAIASQLTAAGYRPIGLDHFARPQDTLSVALADRRLRRNFQGYTDDASEYLIGIGASAISALPQGYVQNTASLNEHARLLDEGRLPATRGLRLTPEDRLRRDVIEQIMCYQRVDLDATARKHGFPVEIFAGERERLVRLAEDGIVKLQSATLRIPAAYRVLMRAVAAVFDAYLEEGTARHARAV